jgi:hypothetical protein
MIYFWSNQFNSNDKELSVKWLLVWGLASDTFAPPRRTDSFTNYTILEVCNTIRAARADAPGRTLTAANKGLLR